MSKFSQYHHIPYGCCILIVHLNRRTLLLHTQIVRFSSIKGEIQGPLSEILKDCYSNSKQCLDRRRKKIPVIHLQSITSGNQETTTIHERHVDLRTCCSHSPISDAAKKECVNRQLWFGCEVHPQANLWLSPLHNASLGSSLKLWNQTADDFCCR